jgi:hypothetical protein
VSALAGPARQQAALSKLDLELDRLRLLLRRRMLWLRANWGADPLRGAGGLVISDEQADVLAVGADRHDEAAFYREDVQAAEIAETIAELELALDRAPPSPLDWLVDRAGLGEVDRELILLALAPALDAGFERLYAYVQDDAGCRLATPQLADDLFGSSVADRLGDDSPLRSLRVLELHDDRSVPWSRRRLQADERLVKLVRGVNRIDPRVGSLLRAVDDPTPVGRQAELAEEVAEYLERQERWPLVHLRAEEWVGTRSVAAAVSGRLGLRLAALDTAAALAEPGLVPLVEREALLLGLALFVVDDGTLSTQSLAERLASLVFIAGPEPLPLERVLDVAVEAPGARAQFLLWQAATTSAELPAEDVHRLVGQFDLGPQQIVRAARSAAATAGRRHADPELADLWQACREQCRFASDGLAEPIVPTASWERLILPESSLAQLEEIADQSTHRRLVYEDWQFAPPPSRGRGITALFAGPSGTGKTMAAEVLADRLRLDLYRIDLAGVVSKYIGETEKNLRRVFDAAENSGAILFFDEADALFGKRTDVKDAHDRYANIEVDYLLQRMEAYRGLAVLATNRRSLLDPAFLRRLRFVVDFPFPDAAARIRLWQGIFPPEAPIGELDFEALARLEIAGGSIRTVALNAAFLAAAADEPIGMEHLMRSARREYTKLERLIAVNEFGSWA